MKFKGSKGENENFNFELKISTGKDSMTAPRCIHIILLLLFCKHAKSMGATGRHQGNRVACSDRQ